MFYVEVGTPNERTRSSYKTAAGAKGRVRTVIAGHKEFADRFNRALADNLALVSREVDDLNITALPPGERRRWMTDPDLSGVRFVFEIWRD